MSKSVSVLVKEVQVTPAPSHAGEVMCLLVDWMASLITPAGAVLLYWTTDRCQTALRHKAVGPQGRWRYESIPTAEACFPLTGGSHRISHLSPVPPFWLMPFTCCSWAHAAHIVESYRFTSWNSRFSSCLMSSWVDGKCEANTHRIIRW